MTAVLLDVALYELSVLIVGLFCLGFFAALALVLVVALVEALVLWAFDWGTFSRAWRDAFWANLTSAAAGIPLGLVMKGTMLTWWGIVICALLSVAIEFGVLWLLKRAVAPKRLLLICGVANAASYFLIVLFLLLRLVLARGSA